MECIKKIFYDIRIKGKEVELVSNFIPCDGLVFFMEWDKVNTMLHVKTYLLDIDVVVVIDKWNIPSIYRFAKGSNKN